MKSLSDYWAARTHRALAHTTDATIRLALALTPIKSVIRVVDNHVPAMTVEYAGVREGKSISYTDFKNGRIRINPLPILDGTLGMAEALDIEIGFALHEASHAQESRDRYKDLIVVKKFNPGGQSGGFMREKEVPAFRPMRIAAYLWNVVEDVRIEEATGGHWPGFVPYFDAVLDYMWGNLEQMETDGSEKPHPALTRALKTLYLACRYPVKAMSKLDPSDAPEVEWWKAWQADYLASRADTKTTIQAGLDHLALDRDIGREMEELTAGEKKEEAAGEALRKQIERLMEEGVDGAYGVCITADGEIQVLDKETAEKVQQLVREGLIEMDPIHPVNGAANPPLHIRKPEETSESRRAYVGKPDAESERLRAALVFRASAPQFDLKLLRQGVMDDEELWRWATGDYRVFSERVVESKPDVFMGLLVDISGSMWGEQLKTAQRLAQLMAWALYDQEGVTTSVWAHTADTSADSSVDLFHIWEPGDPLSRLGLIDVLPHANNADHAALAWCVEQVRHRPEPQRVILVLSDGIPSAHGLGGEPGMRAVRSVVEWAGREGVTVIQIAIDGMGAREQTMMYGSNWLPFTNTAVLPKELAQLMARFS